MKTIGWLILLLWYVPRTVLCKLLRKHQPDGSTNFRSNGSRMQPIIRCKQCGWTSPSAQGRVLLAQAARNVSIAVEMKPLPRIFRWRPTL